MKKGFKFLFLFLSVLTLGLVLVSCTKAHEHTFASEWTFNATEHWHKATCEHTNEVSDKAAHTFSNYEVVSAPTTTQTGEAKRKCTVCSFEEVVTLPILSTENYNITTVEATCTQKGKNTYAWKNATYLTFDVEIAPKGHTYGDWTITLTPTKTTTGTAIRSCTADEVTEEIVLPAIDSMNYDIVETGGDCVTDFDGVYTYKADNSIVIRVHNEASGHQYGEWIIVTKPTHETVGSATKICSECAEVSILELPVLGEEGYDVEVTTPATCLVDGLRKYTLKTDNTIVFEEKIDKLGHDFGDWTVETQPTDTAKGLAKRTCSVGNETEELELPVISDTDYDVVIVDAKVGTKGSKTYTLKTNTNVSFAVEIPARTTYEYDEVINAIKSLANSERAKVSLETNLNQKVEVSVYDNKISIFILANDENHNMYFYYYNDNGKIYEKDLNKYYYPTEIVKSENEDENTVYNILNKGDKNYVLNDALELLSCAMSNNSSNVFNFLECYNKDNFTFSYNEETKQYILTAKEAKTFTNIFDAFSNDQIVSIDNYAIKRLTPIDNQFGLDFVINDVAEIVLPEVYKFAENPTWEWKDDYSSATLTLTSTNYEGKVLKLNAEMEVVTVPATIESAGSVTYTAKLTVCGIDYKDTKTKVLPKTGRTYDLDNISWQWNSDNTKVTVTIPCIEDVKDNIVHEVNPSILTVSEATCEAEGENKLTAKIEFDGVEYKDEKNVKVSAKGHTYNHIDASEPTCTSLGTVEHYECDVCHKVFNTNKEEIEASSITIAKLPHGTESQVDETFSFINKSWDDETHSWASIKDGGFTENRGVQVTTSIGSATAESKTIMKDVTKIIITYNTNQSKGIGKIAVRIGENDVVLKDAMYQNLSGEPATVGYEAFYKLEYVFDIPQTGKVQLSIQDVTENSIYLYSVEVFYTRKVMTHHAESPATCEENGTLEYWHCDECGKNYADVNGNTELSNLIIPAIGHNYKLKDVTFISSSEATVRLECLNDSNDIRTFTQEDSEMTITDDNGTMIVTVKYNGQTFELRAVKTNLSLNSESTNVTLNATYQGNPIPSEGLYIGTTVQVTITANPEYRLTSITYGNKAVELDENTYTKTFDLILDDENGVVVSATVEKGQFVKVTDLNQLDFENKYYAFIIMNEDASEAWDASVTGNDLKTGGKALVNVSLINGFINDYDLSKAFYVEKVSGQADKYTLFASNGKFLTSNTSGKELEQSDVISNDYYLNITFDESGNVLIKSNTTTAGYIRFNPNSSTSTERKGIYKFYTSIADSTTNKHIQLYAHEISKTEAIDMVSKVKNDIAEATKDASIFKTIKFDHRVLVTSNSEVAVVDQSSYTISLRPNETEVEVTLTITSLADSTIFDSISFTVKLNVYTVDQAIELINGLEQNTDKIIVVRGIVSELNSSNHPILAGTNENLVVYKNSTFETLYVGDTILVQGKAKKNNATYQMSNNELKQRIAGTATITLDSTNSSNCTEDMIAYSASNFINGQEITITVNNIPSGKAIKSIKMNNVELNLVGTSYPVTLAHENTLIVVIEDVYNISLDTVNSTSSFTASMINFSKNIAFSGDTIEFTINKNNLPEYSEVYSVKVGSDKIVPVNDVYTINITNNSVLVTVTLEILNSISISGDMTNKEYSLNQQWNPAGLVVTAVYSESGEIDVTNYVTWTYNPSVYNGNSTVSVTAEFGGRTHVKTIEGLTTISGTVYTITFESNGGTDIAQQTKSSGETVEIPSAPTKNSWTFAGWYTRSGDIGNYTYVEYDFNSAVNSDLILYGRWKKDGIFGDGDATYDATVNSVAAKKVGTGSSGGSMKITVAAGTSYLELYAVAWSGVTTLSLNISGATSNPTSLSLSTNSNISGSSLDFSIDDISPYKFAISLSNISEETEITFTSSIKKRFVVWNATCYNF